MRLIDADALVEYFEALARSLANVECFAAADATQTAAETLKLATTIDAEPVVRCNDCTYFKWGDYCAQDKMEHSKCRPDDFCSYAKRKMDGDSDD